MQPFKIALWADGARGDASGGGQGVPARRDAQVERRRRRIEDEVRQRRGETLRRNGISLATSGSAGRGSTRCRTSAEQIRWRRQGGHGVRGGRRPRRPVSFRGERSTAGGRAGKAAPSPIGPGDVEIHSVQRQHPFDAGGIHLLRTGDDGTAGMDGGGWDDTTWAMAKMA